MVMWPDYIGMGGTPEAGVSFYAGPNLSSGLTQAEVQQLSLDYQADPVAFEEVVRFRNKHVDELENLSENIGSYKEFEIRHQAKKASYEHLKESVSNPDELTEIALRAAGMAVFHSHEELREELHNLLELGETFSKSMAEHFATRLPDTAGLKINGRAYRFEKGVLTRSRNEGIHERVTFFAHGEPVRLFVRENYTRANAEAGTLKSGNRYCKVASADEWHALTDDLNTMARY